MAAATRSRERVAPLPIAAWLSVWLRSLLLVTGLGVAVFFLENLASGRRGAPCAKCSSTGSVPPPRPARSAPHPASAALAPALPLSTQTPNYGVVSPRKILWLRGPGKSSDIASP